MKKKPIINIKRLEEVSQKVSDMFTEEKLSSMEVRIIIDQIYNNLESIEDMYVKSNYIKAITPKVSPPGVS